MFNLNYTGTRRPAVFIPIIGAMQSSAPGTLDETFKSATVAFVSSIVYYGADPFPTDAIHLDICGGLNPPNAPLSLELRVRMQLVDIAGDGRVVNTASPKYRISSP